MKVSVISLTCCAGCVSSLMNSGQALEDMLSGDFEIVYSPNFVDLKEIPNVDLAIVEGGVRTKEDERLIREVRAKSRIIVAIGICATHGGITSLGNVLSLKKLLEEDYSMIETGRLPELENLMYPICSFVDIDYYIPGCPPMPMLLAHSLKSIVTGKSPIRHEKLRLVIPTQVNNAPINLNVKDAAQEFIKNGDIKPGLLNRIEMIIRAYDPCIKCATRLANQSFSIEIRKDTGAILTVLEKVKAESR